MAAMTETSNERVLQQASIWSHNRRLYPGWLIAPHEVRERIWHSTRWWIGATVSASQRVEADEGLWLLYELNWRLERSLLPMFEDVAAAAEKVLLTWCRGADDAKGPACVELPSDVPDEALAKPRPPIRTMWKELAFAVLRFHREERHRDAFGTWLDRAAKAEPLSEDERARVCYERALHALSDLDDDGALGALSDWRDSCRDPIWSVRKASLHAELGDLAAGESLATEALDKFRLGAALQTPDIPNLSREGWTMLLLQNLEFARHLENRSQPYWQHASGRFSQLARFQCNPWTELATFESRLDQPAPVTQPSVTRRAGFEPGEYRETRHVDDQGLWQKLCMAYQFMRLCEEAPYPPGFGNVSLSRSKLRHAAEWFIEHDPVRTQTLVLRLRDKDLTHNYLSRHRIAALSAADVAELRELAQHSLADSSAKLTGGESRSDAKAQRKHRCLCTSIDVLARTVIRAPVEEGLKLWDTALQLYESSAVRSDSDSTDALVRLLRSLIASLPDRELASRFRQIIDLPIAGTKSFPSGWLDLPDLTHFFEQRLPSLPAGVVGENWTSVTDRLLDAARDEQPDVRRRAIVRLAALLRYGCLDDSASKKLAEAYWSKLTPEGLPHVVGWLPSACLYLPEPKPNLSEERFRAYACAPRPRPGADANLLHDWIHATRVADESPASNRRYVDWTRDEIRCMVAQMNDWWHALDIVAEEERQGGPAGVWLQALGQTSYREYISEILDVLRLVVIPRIPDDAEAIKAVTDLVDSLAKHGLPVAAVLPAMQIIQPGRDVAPEMRRALASYEGEFYTSALRGFVHWMQICRPGPKSSSAIRLPPPPVDLLRELGMIVATRRQPGLPKALDAVAWVLGNCPETAADRHFLESLVVALEYLWAETKYRLFGSDSDRIPYNDVPRCREQAVRIAALLRSTRAAERETVHKWLEAALSDPLPEVRRAVVEVADAAPGCGGAATMDELIRLIETSLPRRISSEEKELLLAFLPPLLQRVEFASSLGDVPPDEQVQLTALLVVRISQTLSSAEAARSAIKAIVSQIIPSPRRLSDAETAELHDIAVRDAGAESDETLIWLRKWTSRTKNRAKDRKRSNKRKPSGRQSRPSS